MIKGRTLIGKTVLSRNDGQRLDSVKDLVIGSDHRRIVALLIDEGGLFGTATVVPIENVVSIGKDAIIVTDSKAAVRVDKLPAVKEILDSDDNLRSKRIFSETGEEVGEVTDVYFDEKSGEITALELTTKQAHGTTASTPQIEISDVVSIGPDAVIINGSALSRLSGPSAMAGSSPPKAFPATGPTATPTPTPTPKAYRSDQFATPSAGNTTFDTASIPEPSFDATDTTVIETPADTDVDATRARKAGSDT
jgi:uncharacterized protein YrrD